MRKERYITQSKSPITGKYSFRVRIGDVAETFGEKDYPDAQSAFKSAKAFRDNILANGVAPSMVQNKPVREVFEESYELFPVRYETKRKLDGMFDKYIKNKDKDIKDVKSEDILLDLNAMIEDCTNDTITRVLAIWRKIIHTALYKEYITKDVVQFVDAPQSHKISHFKVNKVTDRQSIIEMETLCNKHLKSQYEREIVPLLLEFLYLTGCRICEALALTKDDIKKDHISINKEVGSSMSERLVIRQCKTELSFRNIPLTKEIRKVLKDAQKISKSDLLFGNENGEFFDSTLLGDKIHRIGKLKGLNFNMYSIRHLFATDLTIAGVDERTRIELMGHSNISTTLGYARSNDNLKIEALKKRNK